MEYKPGGINKFRQLPQMCLAIVEEVTLDTISWDISIQNLLSCAKFKLALTEKIPTSGDGIIKSILGN